MAQVQKDTIRQLILSTALDLFAHQGYANTSIADIAKKANISVGNIYRYFKGKQDILDVVVPSAFVDELITTVQQKIMTGKSQSIIEQRNNSDFIKNSTDFQLYLIEHKEQLLILWNGKKTPYEDTVEQLLKRLVDLVLTHFSNHLEQQKEKRDTLEIVYRGYIHMGITILEQNISKKQMMQELDLLNAYHVLGLTAILEH